MTRPQTTFYPHRDQRGVPTTTFTSFEGDTCLPKLLPVDVERRTDIKKVHEVSTSFKKDYFRNRGSPCVFPQECIRLVVQKERVDTERST